MKFHPVLCASFLLATSLTAEAGVRSRDLARKLTSDLVVANVENILQTSTTTDYPADKVMAIEAELFSCGLTYNGIPCLDSKFENFGNAGVKDVDTTDKTGYVFFSRFKMKNDKRILLMSVVANKYDCVLSKDDPSKCPLDPKTKKPIPSKAFRTGNIWAIEPGREKPETYVADFLNCMKDETTCVLRPLLAFDPFEGITEEKLVTEIELIGVLKGNDYRRLYHLAQKAAVITDKKLVERAATALIARSAIVTNSANPVYRSAYLNLVATKYTKQNTLVTAVARDVLTKAVAGSAEQTQAALILAKKGEKSAVLLSALKAGYSNNKVPSELRKDAVEAYAAAAVTPAEKNEIIVLLGSNDSVIRSAAYSVLNDVTLTEENLATIAPLLTNKAVNVRGNAVKALSRVAGLKAMEMMATMMSDKDVDVSSAAAINVTNMLKSLPKIAETSFITLLETTEVKAKATDAREKRVLNEDLIPDRKAALDLAFSKIEGQEISVLTRLKNLATSKKASAVRAEAVEYIGAMTLPSSTQVLISLLVDVDPVVSARLIKTLGEKVLTDVNVDQLHKLSLNKQVVVRRNALAVIGKIQTKKAQNIVLLKSQEKTDASSYLVRKDAAVILGSNYSTEASNRLIEMMVDENAEVRLEVKAQLMKADRIYSLDQVNAIANLINLVVETEQNIVAPLLATTVSSPGALEHIITLAHTSFNVNIKVVALRALTLIDTPEVTNLLLEMYPSEDLVTQQEIVVALSTRTIDANQLPVLSTLINNEEVNIRTLAVRLLAKVGGEEALNVLRVRLEVETDETLKALITATITPVPVI